VSSWRDPARWAALRTEEGCPICQRGAPTNALAQLEASWLEMPADGPMRGYVFLMSRRHVVELHELTDDESAAFMRDTRRVARAVDSVFHPVKLNYEVHGNTVPHLHLHLFPRYRGDPFEGRPIDPRAITSAVYAPGELTELRLSIRSALSE
jgi:diadenosine tetraphosphate (Ap4A) HIT family hydrolase